jgi:hypothetical protein
LARSANSLKILKIAVAWNFIPSSGRNRFAAGGGKAVAVQMSGWHRLQWGG